MAGITKGLKSSDYPQRCLKPKALPFSQVDRTNIGIIFQLTSIMSILLAIVLSPPHLYSSEYRIMCTVLFNNK